MDFWREFRRSFVRSLLPGVLFGGLTFVGYFFMSLAAANGAFPVWCLIFWSIVIFSAAAGICWGTYFFALVPLLDLKNWGVLKNAFLLCMIRPLHTMLTLAVVLGMTFIAAILMPIFVIALLLCWFAVMQMVICYLVHNVADEYILKPYEKQHSNT